MFLCRPLLLSRATRSKRKTDRASWRDPPGTKFCCVLAGNLANARQDSFAFSHDVSFFGIGFGYWQEIPSLFPSTFHDYIDWPPPIQGGKKNAVTGPPRRHQRPRLSRSAS